MTRRHDYINFIYILILFFSLYPIWICQEIRKGRKGGISKNSVVCMSWLRRESLRRKAILGKRKYSTIYCWWVLAYTVRVCTHMLNILITNASGLTLFILIIAEPSHTRFYKYHNGLTGLLCREFFLLQEQRMRMLSLKAYILQLNLIYVLIFRKFLF